jgi:hypothetical protein
MTNGKLINAYVSNSSTKSAYSGFEIITCREISDYDGGTIIEQVKTFEEYLNADEVAISEPFYRIFAVYRPTRWTDQYDIETEYNRKRCLGDFYDPIEATKFLQELTGYEVNIYSI